MATYQDQGIVLRTMRLGEADRIVTLATPEHGKVRAVAKGVRKTKSRLRGRLEPLTLVTMMCWQGRELDVVNQVQVLDPFRAIRGDLDRVSVGLAMAEVVDHVAMEHQPMPELFAMLAGALRTLDAGPSPVLLGAFLWKMLVLEGVGPSLDQCARCGGTADGGRVGGSTAVGGESAAGGEAAAGGEFLVAFDAAEGGFLCRSCRRGQAVSPDAVRLVRRVLGGDLRGALGEPESKATAEVERVAMVATEYHLDRRMRSVRGQAGF